jgi:hypothetical protein
MLCVGGYGSQVAFGIRELLRSFPGAHEQAS